MTNEARTAWICSQAIGDEQPTGSQTGAILRGSKSEVYLYVTGNGLARPFRVHFSNGRFPYYIVFSVFDPTFSEFHPTLIHWTKALHYLRTYKALHSVERVLWSDGHKDGWTFVKWSLRTDTDCYKIGAGAYGDSALFSELPAIPE